MTSSSRRNTGTRRSSFRRRLSMTVGATVFLTLVGTAGASALWTAPAATISGSVVSDTVGIQLSLDKSLAVTYNASMTTTSSRLTVTNTGGVTVPYTVTVPADNSALAQAIVVNAWPATNITNCATTAPLPAGTVTGTWASFPVVSGTSLASGASVYWCIRTTLDRVVAATVGLSVSAAVTATGTLTGTNWASSDVSAAAAQNAQDTEKPTVPTALAASATTSTGATLTWTGSTDNVGVVAYDIYRGTTLVGTSTTLTFTDVGLAPLTTYSYTIKARDAAGNASDASAATSVRTKAISSNVWYKIVNPNSGFCLDGNEANATSGVALIVYGCHGGTNQSWKFQSDGTILAQYAALLMRPSTGASNSNVQLTTAGQTRQGWSLVATGTTGQYQIRNTSTDFCLDVGDNPSAVGQVVQRACSSTSVGQRFTLTEMG